MDALWSNVPVLAVPAVVVEKVSSVADVPHSNFGVVEVLPAVIVPSSVAVVVPIAEGVFVVTETAPT